MRDEVFAGGRTRLDRTRRADVVGCDRIAKQREQACAREIPGNRGLPAECLKERGLLDVRRVYVPVVDRTRLCRNLVPQRVLVGKVRVQPPERCRIHRVVHHPGNLVERRPYVGEHYVGSVGTLADGVLREVRQNRSRESERDDERRAHQFSARIACNSASKVVVAQHACDDEVVIVDLTFKMRLERARVPDARCAAIPDRLEPELVQICLEPRPCQVVGHDARTRTERRLDRWTHRQATLDGLLCEEARSKHHARIRRVRARRDRGDHDIAIPDFLAGQRSAVPVPDSESRVPIVGVLPKPAVGNRLLQQVAEPVSERSELDSVLRPLRTRNACGDRRKVELQQRRVIALARRGYPEHPLRRVVGAHRVDLRVGPTRGRQICARCLVDGEVAHRRTVLGRHVRDRRPVGKRKRRGARSVEFDELPNDLRRAKHLRHGQHEVGRRDAVGEPSGQIDADDVRRQEVHRLAEHRRLGLDSAHAPSDDSETVDHGRMRIGADYRVGT